MYLNGTSNYTQHAHIGAINSLNPFFITGIIDGEGTFTAIVKKSAGHRLGWRVDLVFQIGLHEKDLELLKSIQAYFGGVGVITKPHRNMCAFRVTSPEEISQKVLAHLDKYPLITKKYADYLLFKEITLIMLQGGTSKQGRATNNCKY